MKLNIKFTKKQHIEDIKVVNLNDIGFKFDLPIVNKPTSNHGEINNSLVSSFDNKLMSYEIQNRSYVLDIERNYLDLIIKGISKEETINNLLKKIQSLRIERIDNEAIDYFERYERVNKLRPQDITEQELVARLSNSGIYEVNKELALNIIEEFIVLIRETCPRSIQDLFYYIGLDPSVIGYWLFFNLAIEKMHLSKHTRNFRYQDLEKYAEENIKSLIKMNKSLEYIYNNTCSPKSFISKIVHKMKLKEFGGKMGSKGERLVETILLNNSIEYKREVSFKDFVAITNSDFNARYDFVLYKTGRIACVVEVDGAQHYKFVKKFHQVEKNFIKQQTHDRLKNVYCVKKGYLLVRIPYTDLNSAERIINENMNEILTTGLIGYTNK